MKSYFFRNNMIFNSVVVATYVLLNVSHAKGKVSKVPIFTHFQCATKNISNTEVCIDVHFDDGQENEIATLNYDGPRFDQNLQGYLVPSLERVTITGDWIGSFDNNSTYYITMLSSRIKEANRFYRHEDGITSIVKIDSSNVDNVIDLERKKLQDLSISQPEIKELRKLPDATLILKISALYDEHFRKKVREEGDKAEKIVKNILNQASTYFTDMPSTTKILLETNKNINMSSTRDCQANEETKKRFSEEVTALGNQIKEETNFFILFCYPGNNESNEAPTGHSKIGTMCNNAATERMAIVEYTTGRAEAARVTAHEIGHSLGMDHDFGFNILFEDSGHRVRTKRFSEDRTLCTHVQGIMDYNNLGNNLNWTKCSMDDFRVYHHRIIEREGKFCLDRLPEDSGLLNARYGEKVPLSCDLRNCKTIIAIIWSVNDTEVNRYIIPERKQRFNFKQLVNIQKIFKNATLIDFKGKEPEVAGEAVSANLIINQFQRAHIGAYKCDIRTTKPHQLCPHIQTAQMGVKEGVSSCKLDIDSAGAWSKTFETCEMLCHDDGSCTEEITKTICQCSKQQTFKENTLTFKDGTMLRSDGDKFESSGDLGTCNNLPNRCSECIGGMLGGVTFKVEDESGAWRSFSRWKDSYEYCSR